MYAYIVCSHKFIDIDFCFNFLQNKKQSMIQGISFHLHLDDYADFKNVYMHRKEIKIGPVV